MKIVVDVNHPAHVHYFRNFIELMEKKGHKILITATEKEVTYRLLNNYGFHYTTLGSYGKTFIRKILNLPLIDFRMYKAIQQFDPDIFLGFGSIRAAHCAWWLGKPCINFEDTEHSMGQILLYLPFVSTVCTPSCFQRDLGKKQIRFDGYMELANLHPRYFEPDVTVLAECGLSIDSRFLILRFVSWQATHDWGQSGIINKKKLVEELHKYGTVLITSEEPLDEDLEQYRIKVAPEKLHHLLYFATLYIGEGATTASECAVLGTHAIYVNSLKLGYIHEEDKKYHLAYDFSNQDFTDQHVLKIVENLLNDKDIIRKGKMKRDTLLHDNIDVTKFMVWFIEHYPESIKIWRDDPEIKNQFYYDQDYSKENQYEISARQNW